jgi:hypothetical protein
MTRLTTEYREIKTKDGRTRTVLVVKRRKVRVVRKGAS